MIRGTISELIMYWNFFIKSLAKALRESLLMKHLNWPLHNSFCALYMRSKCSFTTSKLRFHFLGFKLNVMLICHQSVYLTFIWESFDDISWCFCYIFNPGDRKAFKFSAVNWKLHIWEKFRSFFNLHWLKKTETLISKIIKKRFYRE